ncbi:MAG: 50S ribosomal protein L9 [Pseudomonadales bacterium]|jgi:large subunit ribosomal protein L9|nr:50S ribosomal protein L9 [Pseudomonadales bacterium]
MQIILLERIRNLGNLGDEVDVKNGYGRNFLIPKGKAVRATAENREMFESRRAELEKHANDELTAAQGRASALTEATVTIAARAGDEGRLFGSVGPREVADALSATGTEVAKAEVKMPLGPIRQIGEFEIEVHLHSDVFVTVTVVVIPE